MSFELELELKLREIPVDKSTVVMRQTAAFGLGLAVDAGGYNCSLQSSPDLATTSSTVIVLPYPRREIDVSSMFPLNVPNIDGAQLMGSR